MGYQTMLLFLLASLLLQILKINAKVPAIIVFGDSSVDSGNNNEISTVLKSNFEPYGRDFNGGQPTGRFSNGRIPTDFISEAFGIKPTIPPYLDPTYNITHFATGVCFASAGTGYDNATSDVLSVIPLWKEMQYYKEYQKTLRAYLGNEKANENFLAGIAKEFITELYQLGARKISIAGLPPMGCLPLERATNIFSGSDCVEKYNDVSKDFNEKLQEMVMELNKELAGMRLVFSNPYDILLDMIQDPNKFGFEDAVTACCGTGFFEMSYLCDNVNPFTCSDANSYVFWDSFHPTEKTNQIVADHVVKTCLAEFL
ncbi:GDSL esterase/lipase [Melia azedarach]|uniref:GDSL esterase/lipase n=1 Tax=Melia azedarach TaxID=155640 RepID=A0ACC1YMX2_MELAZ|nr:GDSL esterase/lipase [Melia azedarach]